MYGPLELHSLEYIIPLHGGVWCKNGPAKANQLKQDGPRLRIYPKVCWLRYAWWSKILWYFIFIYPWQSMTSCFYGERFVKMPKDILDVETALTKHYLNDSSVNKSKTCGLNLYPHGYKNLLAKCVLGFLLSSQTFEGQFKVLICLKSLCVTSSNFISLVLALLEVYKMHSTYVCFGRHL